MVWLSAIRRLSFKINFFGDQKSKNGLNLLVAMRNTKNLMLWADFLFSHFISYFIYFSFIFISWRLITLQYCSGFCHTLT